MTTPPDEGGVSGETRSRDDRDRRQERESWTAATSVEWLEARRLGYCYWDDIPEEHLGVWARWYP